MHDRRAVVAPHRERHRVADAVHQRGGALATELHRIQPRKRRESELQGRGPEVIAGAGGVLHHQLQALEAHEVTVRLGGAHAGRRRQVAQHLRTGRPRQGVEQRETHLDGLDAGAFLHAGPRLVEFRLGKFISPCVMREVGGDSSARRAAKANPMKLATYKDGSRDGQLVVVSRDLASAHYATGIAGKLQQALDDWGFVSPQLQDLSETLNQGKARHAFPFEPQRCMAPLPRAYQWADGSAFINHVELVRAARKAEVPETFYTDPLMYQGGSDDFLGPCDDVPVPSEAFGIDFEAEVAVITGDVPMGAAPEQALEGIRLLMLANDVSLRNLIPAELAKGFGFFQSKPATAFSPVAVTPDEVGDAWQGGRLHLTLQSTWNGRKVGMCEAGPEMTFHFGQLIAHICKTRNVRAGSIVCSGTVSNKGVEQNGRMDWPKGYSCIAETPTIETIQDGQPSTGFMKFGDTIRIEVKGKDGSSVFGAIDQKIVPLAK